MNFDTLTHNNQTARTSGRSHSQRAEPELLKKLADALGFQARFDSAAVRSAYVEVCGRSAFAQIEVRKNAKPSDIAFRYAKSWNNSEARTNTVGRTGRSDLNSWVATALALPDLPARLVELLQTELTEHLNEGTQIRINFKDRLIETQPVVSQAQSNAQAQTVGCSASQQEQFPVLNTASATIDTSPVPASATEVSEMSTSLDTNGQTEANSWKYSTYSRSEVDRLLKIQAEQITSQLGSKLTSQTKALQDALSEQSKGFAKVIDRLERTLEESRTKLDGRSTAHEANVKAEFTKFQQELSKELEQFKAQLNKNMLPSAKSISEKLSEFSNLVQEQSARSSAPSKSQTPSLLLILVGLSLAVSVVNVVLIVAHH